MPPSDPVVVPLRTKQGYCLWDDDKEDDDGGDDDGQNDDGQDSDSGRQRPRPLSEPARSSSIVCASAARRRSNATEAKFEQCG